MRDDSRINNALRKTIGRKYQPSAEMVGSVAASRAVAPAGGYTALANTIAAEASPQARAPASHRSSSKLLLSLNSSVTPTPTKAARRCPTTLFRGWARGDSMKLYSNTAAAPYGVPLAVGLHRCACSSYKTGNSYGNAVVLDLGYHQYCFDNYNSNKGSNKSPPRHQHVPNRPSLSMS